MLQPGPSMKISHTFLHHLEQSFIRRKHNCLGSLFFLKARGYVSLDWHIYVLQSSTEQHISDETVRLGWRGTTLARRQARWNRHLLASEVTLLESLVLLISWHLLLTLLSRVWNLMHSHGKLIPSWLVDEEGTGTWTSQWHFLEKVAIATLTSSTIFLQWYYLHRYFKVFPARENMRAKIGEFCAYDVIMWMHNGKRER